MDLFKNTIGRPSKKILLKRKIVYMIVGIITFGMIFVGSFILLQGMFGAGIKADEKNATIKNGQLGNEANSVDTPNLDYQFAGTNADINYSVYSLIVSNLNYIDKLEVYSSSSKNGEYKLLQTFDVKNLGSTQVFDIKFYDGSSTTYYKVRTYKQEKEIYSDFSNIITIEGSI